MIKAYYKAIIFILCIYLTSHNSMAQIRKISIQEGKQLTKELELISRTKPNKHPSLSKYKDHIFLAHIFNYIDEVDLSVAYGEVFAKHMFDNYTHIYIIFDSEEDINQIHHDHHPVGSNIRNITWYRTKEKETPVVIMRRKLQAI